VNPSEQNPKVPSAQTGFFAASAAVLGVKGRGAPAAPRLHRVALSLVLLCAVLFALTASSASAAPPKTFCTAGEAAGHCVSPTSVAVDQSNGTVYLADAGNHRVDVFDSEGHFLRAFGWGVLNHAPELQTCTTACGAGISGSGPGQMEAPLGLAVDSASHDLYVIDNPSSHRIEKFNEEGKFLLMFGSEVDKTTHADVCTAEDIEVKHDLCGAGLPGSGPGAISRTPAIALDSSHHLWVAEFENERLEQFGPGGEFLSEIKLPGSGTISSLAIDTDPLSPSFEDIYTLKQGIGGRNEGQLITRHQNPDTFEYVGPYTLTFEGQTTAPISVKATGAEIQESLEKLSTVGAGNVRVDPGTTWVTFTGALTATDVEQLVPSANASVETVTQGKPEIPGVLTKRKPNGEAIETLDASGHPQALGLDPATGDLFVSDQANPELNPGTATLLSFDSSGVQLDAFATGQVIGHPEVNALAFGDSAQRLYVASDAAAEDSDSAAQIFAVPAPGPYPIEGTSRATEVKKTAATLCSKINPEGVSTTFHFDYITAAKFKEDHEEFGAGTQETGESASIGSDFTTREACQTVSPLTPATAYRFRILATNTSPGNPVIDGEAAEFTALPPAAIDSTSVTDVTATSATLHAEINPLGDATSYRFEYLTQEAFKRNEEEAQPPFAGAAHAPLEPAPIGAGSSHVSVSQHLQGLVPHTAYRYRVVAFNSLAPAGFPGSTLSFTTQATGIFALPDNREWELVSPPDKHGALLEHFGYQSAASGDAITYLATVPTEAEPAGYIEDEQVLSTRGSAGWSSRDITPAHTEEAGSTAYNAEREYSIFSSDLSLGVLQPQGRFEPSTSPQATEQTPYLRTNFSPADPTSFCGQSCYRPLLTGAEGFADVSPGTRFSTEGKCSEIEAVSKGELFCGPQFVGGSPDFGHLVVQSRVALTPTPLSKGGYGLYEWSKDAAPAESLRLISVLPDGQPAVAPKLGAGATERMPETRSGTVSSDGSRVLWLVKSGVGIQDHFYLRYNATQEQSQVSGGQCTEAAKACTLQLDTVQGGSGTGEAVARLQFASPDGSVVFFTDRQRLTPNSGASESAPDLYRCQVVEEAGGLHCVLTDLTPFSGESAGVQGSVLGASSDGSSIYFVANGVLTGNEENEHGETARPGSCEGEESPRPGGACNLYVYRDGAPHFIAVLPIADHPSWGATNISPAGVTFILSARVSPDGRWLAFMSSRPLTGYDNRDVASGVPVEELYLYDAVAGALHCASCNPTGARPHSWKEAKGHGGEGSLLGISEVWSKGSLAAVIPGWTDFGYRTRPLSNSGRVFFDAFDSLAPGDSNGTWDVYEFEMSGLGDCTESSPSFVARSGGCVGLVSSGISPEPSAFLDASESGNDVFFYTQSALARQDFDTARDIYDAHVCSTESPCLPPEPPKPPACEGDACQSPAIAPEDPTPGSLSFKGPGNVNLPVAPVAKAKSKQSSRGQKLARALRACGKQPKRRRAVCQRQARRAYGPVGKAKKSNRRAH
jgi:hypothetical protein